MIDTDQLIQDVFDGNESPVKAWAILDQLEKMIKYGKTTIQNYALSEAEKYGAKSFEDFGFSFELRNGRRTYDFKHIQEWVEAEEQKKKIEDKYKQAFMNYEKGLNAVTQDGEVLELPVVKYTNDSLIIKNK